MHPDIIFPVRQRTVEVYVCQKEGQWVCLSAERDVGLLPYHTVGSFAADEPIGGDCFLRAIRLHTRSYLRRVLLESHKFRIPFDVAAAFNEDIPQDLFSLTLRNHDSLGPKRIPPTYGFRRIELQLH